MPWTPLPRIAFAIATYPFNPTTRDDLPLQLGDELYIIESCANGQWFRGYLVAPPSLLAGLTSTKGATLEARVFSGIFPAACVEIKEYLTTEIPALEDVDEDGFVDDIEQSDVDDGASYTEQSDAGDVSASEDGDLVNGDSGIDDGLSGLSEFGDNKPGPSSSPVHSQMNGGIGADGLSAADRADKERRRKQRIAKKSSAALVRSSVIGPGGRDPNRQRPAAPVPMLKVGDETPSCEGEPLVDEIASCLREWHAANLHELLLARQYPLLDEICNLVQDLGVARRQLLHNVLTKAELARTREKTVWALVRGNKLLSREVIVRDPKSGRILTGDDSAVEITSLQSQMSLLDAPPQTQPEHSTLHHLLLDVKAFVGISPDPTTIVFYLANKVNKPISESFSVELTPQGVPVDVNQLGKIKTLFVDLSTRDILEDIYLVARIYNVVTIVPPGGAHIPQPIAYSSSGAPSSPPQSAAQPTVQSPKEPKLSGRISVLFSPRDKAKDEKGQKLNQKSSMANMEPLKEKKSLNSVSESENVPTTSHTPPVPQQTPTVRKIAFKRAVGVGVLDVGRFLRQDSGTEQVMRIFVPLGGGNHSVRANGVDVQSYKGSTTSNGTIEKRDHGEDWDRLVRDVIESNSQKFEKSAKADRLHLYLRPFAYPEASTLIRKNPTILHNITCTPKIGFSGAPTKPRSDFYVTIANPHLPRHALLLHPRTGSVPLPPSSNFTQIQLTVEVRKSSGHQVKNCIIPYSNAQPVTVWRSSVGARDDSWYETIRLSLKDEDISKVHVFITLSSVPHPPVALAWFPLWDNNAFLKDDDHSLLFHKMDEYTSSPMSTSSGTGGYLSLPWVANNNEGWAGALAMGGAAASVRVRTFLCSTRYSQDEVLLQLLNWREAASPEALVTLLKKVVFVSEIELVKLLREVFDALFGILVDHAGREDIEDLVFIALITVLGIVYDRRFHLEPIVDDYTEHHFNYPFATASLLKSFTRLLSSAADPESAKRLRATFKVGKHIFRFIVTAREKQKAKEEALGITGSNVQNFPRDLHGVFKLLESLMRSNAAMHVGSQTLAVQHFHTWLPELVPILSREQILLIAIDFLDSCAGVKGKLILYKLVLIVNYSKSLLFADADSRRALTLNTVRWLEPHWGKTDDVNTQYREQVRLCCSILSTQIDELSEEVSEYVPKIVESYTCIQATGPHERESFSLLFPKTYPFPTRSIPDRPIFDEALIELAAILAAISNIPVGLHLDLQDDELASFLMKNLLVHLSILRCEAFPDSWLSTHIFHHRATLRTLETIAGVLVDQFLPDPDDAQDFNTELWQAFFTTLLMLVGSPSLALETFPEQKRRAVWKIAGDVRELGADLLRRTWEAIGWETTSDEKTRFGLEKMGGYQVQYVPGLVAPIVELCLSVHEGLRGVAVEVLQTMIVSEWNLGQDVGVIQAEMIDTLDRLFKAKRLTESITQKAFILDLQQLFEPLSQIPSDPLYTCVRNLLKTIEEFLDLLVAVHNTPLGEAYHIMDTLRLMDFLKHMHKEDMYIRYVHQLVTVQLENQDFVEAGLSLKLHADLYKWDPETICPALDEPILLEQSAFDRKEFLYLQMIKYFEDGKSWDNAIALYKELAEQYENHIFDYAKLAKAQRAMAKIHENVMAGDWYSPQYFRVAYLGMGFPTGLRDRQFIVQGYHDEKLAGFTERIQQMHPSAKIVSIGEITTVEGQYVQITPVHPEHDLKQPLYRRAKVAPYTRNYMLNTKPKKFAAVRAQPAGDKSNTELWVEKTLYVTAEAFPTILRRSEIVSMSTALASPFENAIAQVHARTLTLAGLEKQFAECSPAVDLNLNPLTMGLTGALDQSGAGVFQYRQMLAPGRADALPEWIAALRVAILDFVAQLKKVMAIHGRLVQAQMKPVHENMSAHFEHAFATELALLVPAVQPPPISPGRWRSPLFSPSQGLPAMVTTTSRPLQKNSTFLTSTPGGVVPLRPMSSAALHRPGARTTIAESAGSTTIVPATARARISNMLGALYREKSAKKHHHANVMFSDAASAPAGIRPSGSALPSSVNFKRPGTAASGTGSIAVTAVTGAGGLIVAPPGVGSSGGMGGILKRRPSRTGSIETTGTKATGGSGKSKAKSTRSKFGFGSSGKDKEKDNTPAVPALPDSHQEYRPMSAGGPRGQPTPLSSRAGGTPGGGGAGNFGIGQPQGFQSHQSSVTNTFTGASQPPSSSANPNHNHNNNINNSNGYHPSQNYNDEERDAISELRRPSTTGSKDKSGGLVERMGSVKRRFSSLKLGGGGNGGQGGQGGGQAGWTGNGQIGYQY